MTPSQGETTKVLSVPNVSAAAHAAIDANFTKYTTNSGTDELKRAVCARYKTDYGVEYTPAETIITAGTLIDRAGLKGLTVGAAQVAEKHANYILNLGGASDKAPLKYAPFTFAYNGFRYTETSQLGLGLLQRGEHPDRA